MRSRRHAGSLEMAIELASIRKPGFTPDDLGKLIAAARTDSDIALAHTLNVAFATLMRPSEIAIFKPTSIRNLAARSQYGDRCANVIVERHKAERFSQAQKKVLVWGKYVMSANIAMATMTRLRVNNLSDMYKVSGAAAVRRLLAHIRALGKRAKVSPDKLHGYSCRHGAADWFAELDPVLLRIQGGWAPNSTMPQQFYQGGSATRAVNALATQERRMVPQSEE